MFLTGTVMPNRIGILILHINLEIGDMEEHRKNYIAVVFQKDKKIIMVLTNKRKVSTNNNGRCASQFPNQPLTQKQKAMTDYTKYVGEVDHTDHFIANYQFMRSTTKLYRKILLEASIELIPTTFSTNVGRKRITRPPMIQKQFRCNLIEDLVKEKLQKQHTAIVKKPGRPSLQRL